MFRAQHAPFDAPLSVEARPVCPHAGMVAVRVKSTGEIRHAWPVDARELVTLSPDEYEYVAAAV